MNAPSPPPQTSAAPSWRQGVFARRGGVLHRRLRDLRAALLRAADPADAGARILRQPPRAPRWRCRRPRSRWRSALVFAGVDLGGDRAQADHDRGAGRRRRMATLGCAAAPSWGALLALRALTGLALSGLPAVAMAYLADEIAPSSLGFAMGLYISGSTIGGMVGRVTVGGHRRPLELAGRGRRDRGRGACWARSISFSRCRASGRSRQSPDLRRTRGDARRPLPRSRTAAAVRRRFFWCMGAFVCAYNYYGFRLERAAVLAERDARRLRVPDLSRRARRVRP